MNNVELQNLVGGQLQIAATKAIKEYLQFELADMTQFTVIS